MRCALIALALYQLHGRMFEVTIVREPTEPPQIRIAWRSDDLTVRARMAASHAALILSRGSGPLVYEWTEHDGLVPAVEERLPFRRVILGICGSGSA